MHIPMNTLHFSGYLHGFPEFSNQTNESKIFLKQKKQQHPNYAPASFLFFKKQYFKNVFLPETAPARFPPAHRFPPSALLWRFAPERFPPRPGSAAAARGRFRWIQ